jgi:hypothetical protein
MLETQNMVRLVIKFPQTGFLRRLFGDIERIRTEASEDGRQQEGEKISI